MACPDSAVSSDVASILLSAFTVLRADRAKLLIASLPGKAAWHFTAFPGQKVFISVVLWSDHITL